MAVQRRAHHRPSEKASRLSPRALAEFATRRPKTVLGIWGAIVLVAMGLTGAFFASGLTSDGGATDQPESIRAQDLIDARLPQRDAVDDVIVVRSEDAVVTAAPFRRRVDSLVADVRRTGQTERVRSYLAAGATGLVSADRHATLIQLVVGDDADADVDKLIATVERADGQAGFAVDVTGQHTAGHDFG